MSTGLYYYVSADRHVAMASYDHLFKVLLIGDAGVGKSSLLLRYTEDKFDDALGSTIGVDFKVKTVKADGKRVKLTLWDTAGQDRFRTLTSSYYRGAQGVVLVYDVTRRATFDDLQQWLVEVDAYTPGGGEEVVKLLVGNKIDREVVVPRTEAAGWARRRGMLFVETSAKAAVGVTQAFCEVVNKILENPVLVTSTMSGRKRADLAGESKPTAAAACC